jgi:3-phosphoshikimate 1-carboxyvinyltransferase
MLLQKSVLKQNKTVLIGGSKSISNRLLVLESLFNYIKINNLSDSQDTFLLQKALSENSEIVNIQHAGTAMRFLTSYFAVQEGKTTILTGSERMKQRPIKFLVDALLDLGAEIQYIENEGFPPLKIIGKKLKKDVVKISADISSQFITSLLLMAGKLKTGLTIELVGKITSKPYIEMTLKMLTECGIQNEFSENRIKIFPFQKTEFSSSTQIFEVESDWSSASYYYSLCAIGKKNIHLKSFEKNSLQGDSVIKQIYSDFFGVNTVFNETENKILLFPEQYFKYPEQIQLNMNDCPDIAQTLCVTATALKIPFELTGLSTLKIKETDRLSALKNELNKIGCISEITDDSIKSVRFFETNENISITTYNDHRMAMSFAPFCLVKTLTIENEKVVEKSYPNFWQDFMEVIDYQ